MSNIITFEPRQRPCRTSNITALLRGVAQGRRPQDDVYWLKENAEVLNVLTAMGEPVAAESLAPFEQFYDSLEERVRFYPQYYRFLLSICLDLEDLGMPGSKGASLCRWIATTGLARAELSDLQRAEALRLLARRGAAEPIARNDLGERLTAFIDWPETFALPNRKAAYELTHIVFYLSDYGQRDPGLSEAALTSLEFAGLVAFLDQNHDLLAEICLALRFAGRAPSAIWMETVAQAHAAITPVVQTDGPAEVDGFHAYLVTGWAQAVAGEPAFFADIPDGALRFADRTPAFGALRPLSECLLDLGSARRGDWSGMRGRVIPSLDAMSRDVLQRAEQSSPLFEAFFEGFSRARTG